MIVVNTNQAKSQLSQLIARIEKGRETVRICRNGVPVADMVPIKDVVDPLRQHPELTGVEILYDPVSPLDEDEWPETSR